MFRSQEMKYVTLTITSEAVHSTLRQIGRLEKFHIVNLADPDHPTEAQVHSKRRMVECNFWKRKLDGLEERMKNAQIEVPAVSLVEASVFPDAVAAVEEFIVPVERELEHHDAFQLQTLREISRCIERYHVLERCQNLNPSADVRELERQEGEQKQGSAPGAAAVGWADPNAMELQPQGRRGADQSPQHASEHRFQNFLSGVIDQSSQSLLQRMVYRVSRGNALVRYFDIEEPILDPERNVRVARSVFYIVCLGDQLLQRLTKLCESLNARLYPLPPAGNPAEIREALEQASLETEELRRVYDRTQLDIVRTLTQLAGTIEDSPLRRWQETIQTEGSICGALMQCRFYNRLITMEGWVPAGHVDDLQQCLQTAALQSNSPVAHCRIDGAAEAQQVSPASGTPPTYFETNKYIGVFQGIVDTYGIPRYQEVNPGLFTIITFPFLFGVMYGDIGHSTLLLLFSAYLIWTEAKLQAQYDAGKMNEILQFAFGGRYLLFLMSAFGLYCGFVYNDLFSVPLSIYQSRFWFPDPVNNETEVEAVWRGGTYPFGIDPAWYGSTNELEFFNSLKMKLSVILGVVQMSAGIFLSLFNHIHFKDHISAWFEFVPRLVFMTCVFGYMIIMIIYKWTVAWEVGAPPPNLVQTMVNMFLSPGSVADDEVLYSGQAGVQTFLLLVAFLCVPVMLCGPPCMRHHLAKKASRRQLAAAQALPVSINGGHGPAAAAAAVSSSDAVGSGFGDLSDADYKGLSGGDDEGRRKLLGDDDDEAKFADVEMHAGGRGLAALAADAGSSAEAAAVSKDHGGEGHGEEHSLSEMMVHNGIHTIEFVLGCVSNTASYLRLWALSLAHAQLSLVFWEKLIMQYGLETGNPAMVFVGFAMWAVATFGVLLCMDMLECFLHALRLHWVEFQNKFYYADGHAFTPFSLEEKVES